MTPKILVNADQAWFWTERWQAMERDADADFAAVRGDYDTNTFVTQLQDEIRRLAQRSGELNLWLRAPEQESLFPVGICITTLVLEARERFLKRLKHQET